MCFKCGHEAHKPASCAEVETWQQREKDDGATIAWLNAHTKRCPKCRIPIEKNEGCIHMTCRTSAGCGHQFCWICLEPWAGNYSCNKKPASRAAGDEASGADLMFYYERFMHQRDAVSAIHRLEADLSAEWANLLAARRGDGATQDALNTTLANAREVVTRGRHAAKWAYVHALNISAASVSYRALFEDSQGMLEHHLENLHERCVPSTLRRLTEGLTRDYEAGVVAVEEWRRAVTQYAAATSQFLGNLLHFVISEREAALVAEERRLAAAARGGAGAPPS